EFTARGCGVHVTCLIHEKPPLSAIIERCSSLASKETHLQTRLAAGTPYALSLLRIVSAYLLLLHGTAKLLGIPFVPMFAQFQPTSLAGAAAVIELVCGTLLLIGLLTRSAAFLASGLCAAAYFVGHVVPLGNPIFPLLNGGEAS